jgi:hypothetical protein
MKGFRAYFQIPTTGSCAVPRNTYSRIVIQQNTPTDIETIQPSEVGVQKIIRDGQIVIIRNGELYDVTGKKL